MTDKAPLSPETEKKERDHHKYKNLIPALPVTTGWPGVPLHLYKGFWIPQLFLPGVIAAQEHLVPRPDDVLLASYMKSGSGWLRALAFAIVNRGDGFASLRQALQTRHAQQCAFFIDFLFAKDEVVRLDLVSHPRLLATHAPYSLLPISVKDSECKVVYLCRDPKDTLVSMWHFLKLRRAADEEPFTLKSAFDLFSHGVSPYGPIWDHQLEYWQESMKRPTKLLFLKYEDMILEPEANVKRLAEFIGRPISEEEEKDRVVEEIVALCSFDSLKNMEANKVGVIGPIHASSFFRRGKVGDWVEHLSPEMARKLDQIIEEKLGRSGLSFKLRC